MARTESETPGRELATSSSQHFHRVRLLARSASGRPNVGTASLAFADLEGEGWDDVFNEKFTEHQKQLLSEETQWAQASEIVARFVALKGSKA